MSRYTHHTTVLATAKYGDRLKLAIIAVCIAPEHPHLRF